MKKDIIIILLSGMFSSPTYADGVLLDQAIQADIGTRVQSTWKVGAA